MQATALSFGNIHEHGSLFTDILKFRHAMFIEQKGWDLPSHDGMEFDQYDTAQAVWIGMRDEGRLVSGARIMPTTARCADYSYMIRDAQLEKLKDIPSHLLFDDAPVCPTVWELSRGQVCPHVPPDRRDEVYRFFLKTVTSEAKARGASLLIALTTLPLKRYARRAGYDIIDVGPRIVIERPNQAIGFRLD